MLIRIINLKARTLLGVYDWEKEAKREIILNLEMSIDAPKAGTTDALDDTLDYDAVQNMILNYLDKAEANLIETLAEGILQRLSQFPLIQSATLEISKPGALKHAESVAVVVSREY